MCWRGWKRCSFREARQSSFARTTERNSQPRSCGSGWHGSTSRRCTSRPGSPWENGYIESFNGKLRDELLDREIFYTLHEAKILIDRWRQEYNTFRPHSALGYRPPAPEAVQWPNTNMTWPQSAGTVALT
jgi:hypothetical protein